MGRHCEWAILAIHRRKHRNICEESTHVYDDRQSKKNESRKEI